MDDRKEQRIDDAVQHISDALQGQDQEAKEEAPDPEQLKQQRIDHEKYPSYYRLHAAIREKYCTAGDWNPVYFDRHEEDVGYDDIRISILPRYKTSGLSGDEWRFSYVAEIFWKGFRIGSRGWSRMEHAIRSLDNWINYLQESIQFEFKKYDDEPRGHPWAIAFPDHRLLAEFCAQPGCPNLATHTFIKKNTYCVGPGNCGAKHSKLGVHAVRFCPKHCTRGDCDMEDADSNLELFEALAERDETERYSRESKSGVRVIDLTVDKFGQGSIPPHELHREEGKPDV